MNKSRFDLESEILECWQITSDLRVLGEAVGDGASYDTIMNIIIGLEQLYDLRFAKTMQTLSKIISEGKL
jgi:hypothetical protein